MEGPYVIIAYLIGQSKYKQVSIKQFNDKQTVIREYRKLLNNYAIKYNDQFVMVMLNGDLDILTAWAMETPAKLIEAAKLALDTFEKGEVLYIDKNLKMVNLFGSQVYEEIVDEGKRLGVLSETDNILKN